MLMGKTSVLIVRRTEAWWSRNEACRTSKSIVLRKIRFSVMVSVSLLTIRLFGAMFRRLHWWVRSWLDVHHFRHGLRLRFRIGQESLRLALRNIDTYFWGLISGLNWGFNWGFNWGSVDDPWGFNWGRGSGLDHWQKGRCCLFSWRHEIGIECVHECVSLRACNRLDSLLRGVHVFCRRGRFTSSTRMRDWPPAVRCLGALFFFVLICI